MAEDPGFGHRFDEVLGRIGVVSLTAVVVLAMAGCNDKGPARSAEPDGRGSTPHAAQPGTSSFEPASPSPLPRPEPPEPRITGEPAAIQGKLRWPWQTVTSANGTMMQTYGLHHGWPARGCYFRLIQRDGSVVGWFGPSGVNCPTLHPYDNGFLATPGVGRYFDVENLSTPPRHPRVRVDTTIEKVVRPGDSYVGICGNTEPEMRLRRPLPPVRWSFWAGCLYSAETNTLSGTKPGYLVDAAGWFWFLARRGEHGERRINITDGQHAWHTQQVFPSFPFTVVSAGNGSAATAVLKHWHRIYVTSDAGHTWTAVQAPSRDFGELAMLPDGRLLLGPAHGRMWRGADARNLSFKRLPAGPITQVSVAGDIVYGQAPPDLAHAQRGVVWMSTDGASTWRQVVSSIGATGRTRSVSTKELPQPLVPPMS